MHCQVLHGRDSVSVYVWPSRVSSVVSVMMRFHPGDSRRSDVVFQLVRAVGETMLPSLLPEISELRHPRARVLRHARPAFSLRARNDLPLILPARSPCSAASARSLRIAT